MRISAGHVFSLIVRKNPHDLSSFPAHLRHMKTTFALLVIIIAVLASGCTAAAPAVTPAPATTPAIPSLVGTWTGPMAGYDEGSGFTSYPNLTLAMTITEQHGRIFAGDMVFSSNGTSEKSGFAGAIGRDGRTLSITEQDDGYCSGEIIGADEIELTYVQAGSPYSVAIDSFKRV